MPVCLPRCVLEPVRIPWMRWISANLDVPLVKSFSAK